MRDRALYGLVALSTLLGLGHHLDHVIRGNHVGWPLTTEPTPFTYSLAVYPLILLGLALARSGRAGPGYWAILTGAGALFVAAIHFGPGVVEPPADIIDLHESRAVGWFAFAWLVAFVGVLAATCCYAGRAWFQHRATA